MMKTILLSLGASICLAQSVLSSRPDMVTGGSALVRIGNAVRRVDGLKPGRNIVSVDGHKLELVNHPITGPVFSGPHQTPFVCQTEDAGLGPALDANCTAPARVTYHYHDEKGFKPFDPAAPRPADLIQATTTQGKTVPYIVRREVGVINRAIYEIAFLHEPGTPLPDPWTSTPGWNGRLVYSFGGGCQAGYRQAKAGPGLNDGLLSKGYAQAASTLNVFGNNCNDVLSAETLMMVKEHFIRNFGVPAYTIGNGGSGGSMQQHLIAQNYPGLIDGITPTASYPDIVTLIPPVTDCALLTRAFEGSHWTDEQKTAVSGFATWNTCASWIKARFAPGWIDPGRCDASLPTTLLYNPVTNPKGTRCGLQDNMVNVYGRDPKTGFARGIVDNVGVQYGLVAFNAGKITADQFLELNQRVGGFDADANFVAKRTVAGRDALRVAYTTGRVNSGGGSLSRIPIIDSRRYVDREANIHDLVRTNQLHARLVRAHGSAANRVVLTNPVGINVIRLMDQWLTDKAKPGALVDGCWTQSGERLTSKRCQELYPAHGDPRLAAGAPPSNDVLKCALKPIAAIDYRPPLTDPQLVRLRGIFPEGVCDYTRAGIEQTEVVATWRKY